jgi:hypothetical protein
VRQLSQAELWVWDTGGHSRHPTMSPPFSPTCSRTEPANLALRSAAPLRHGSMPSGKYTTAS